MKKRLKDYINYLNEQLQYSLSTEEKRILKGDLLTQIMFFQHERLIHLIVTVTFAILAMFSFLFIFLYENIFIFILLFLILILLFPYIRHYFILERGVQRLYEYYDKLNSGGNSHEINID